MPPFLPTHQLSNSDHQGTAALDLSCGMATAANRSKGDLMGKSPTWGIDGSFRVKKKLGERIKPPFFPADDLKIREASNNGKAK